MADGIFRNCESKMSGARIDAAVLDVAKSETTPGGERHVAYFANHEPIDGRFTIVDLTATSCRWPTGDPRDLRTFRYCGAAAHGGPYCERHSQLAYLARAA
jgi:hypothetical protein